MNLRSGYPDRSSPAADHGPRLFRFPGADPA
jgi:hypothetical protein